jgi:ABC-type oligopeptide transport system ATPase subunit
MERFFPLVMAAVPLLAARGLTKEFPRQGVFARPRICRAVDSVDFFIPQSLVMALVGASGSGKSTLGRCLVGLETPTRGQVLYQGVDIAGRTLAQMRDYRRRVQIVFQEAAGSINPRFTAAAAVSEPLRIAHTGNRAEQRDQALYWMEQVGLPPELADRPALECSGGQRQRLGIARALISQPAIVIFDEAFSALDLPVETHILELLVRLRESYDLTYLLISHDLTLLSRICSQAAVMYQGKIVERTTMESLLSNPVHPYSRELVGAIPRLPAG